MFNKVPVKGKKTVCIVSGGNIDVTILSRVINRGLSKSGRRCTLIVELPDKPGQLSNITRITAELGANIVSVHHERNGESPDVSLCYLRIAMETRNEEHIEEIKDGLLKAGYHLLNN